MQERVLAIKPCVERYNSFLECNNLPDRPEIILINPPLDIYISGQREIYKTLPPFGLGMLATIAERKGTSVSVLDAEAMRLSPKEIASIINRIDPNIIGFNITSPVVHIIKKIYANILKKPKLVIGGGVHATTLPSYTFKQLPFLDVVFLGEAEDSWSKFVDNYHSSNKKISINLFNGVDGIQFSNGPVGNIKQNENLDLLPQIDTRHFYNQPYTNNGKKEIGLLSSRGCTYECEYCAASEFSGHRIRYRSITNIVDEIEYHFKNGITYFHFGDDNFTISRNRLKLFRKELEKRNLKIHWKSFSRIEAVDEDSITDMKLSGCYQLTFGLESGTYRVLKMMNKKIILSRVPEIIKLCKKNSIKTKGFFIIGYPGETLNEIRQSVSFAKRIKLDAAFFYMARAFPGTKLFEKLTNSNYKYEDLLQYQHIYPKITNKLLNVKQKKIKKWLESEGIFDLTKTLKYNISHKITISSLSISELCSEMANAYISFYYNEEYTNRVKY